METEQAQTSARTPIPKIKSGLMRLRDPVADRLRRWLKLLRQFLRRQPRRETALSSAGEILAHTDRCFFAIVNSENSNNGGSQAVRLPAKFPV